MLNAIARNWWILLVRGIAAITFGVLAFTWPEITLLAFIALFAAYALIDGAAAIQLAFAGRGSERAWWEMFMVGILGVATGLLASAWPGVTAVSLIMIIATWAIARGIFEIGAAMQMQDALRHEFLLFTTGVLSLLFGVLLLGWPAAGILAVIWLIGLYAVLFGAVSLAFAWHLRHVKNRLDTTTSMRPARLA